MKTLEESVVTAMDGSDSELFSYLPYILQDIWEIGTSPEVIIDLVQKHTKKYSNLKVLDLGCGKGAVLIKLANKVYLLDTGFKTLMTGQGDMGAKAENACFLKLLRDNKSCGYFAKAQREVDFILGNIKNPLPIEVKYESDFDWGSKKFAGLKLFLKDFPKTEEAIIVSKDVETELKEGRTTVKVIPLWKFLLKWSE